MNVCRALRPSLAGDGVRCLQAHVAPPRGRKPCTWSGRANHPTPGLRRRRLFRCHAGAVGSQPTLLPKPHLVREAVHRCADAHPQAVFQIRFDPCFPPKCLVAVKPHVSILCCNCMVRPSEKSTRSSPISELQPTMWGINSLAPHYVRQGFPSFAPMAASHNTNSPHTRCALHRYSRSCDIEEPRALARAATAGLRRRGFFGNERAGDSLPLPRRRPLIGSTVAGDVVLPKLVPIREELVRLPSCIEFANRCGRQLFPREPLPEKPHHLRIDSQSVIAPQQHTEVPRCIIAHAMNRPQLLVQLVAGPFKHFEELKRQTPRMHIARKPLNKLGTIPNAGVRLQFPQRCMCEVRRGWKSVSPLHGRRDAPPLHQSIHHADRLSPGNVARADHFYDVLEQRRASDQAAKLFRRGGAMRR